MEYDTIIGLETHAELLTKSKLWCACPTRFGEPANTQTCPVCLGLPGVLPVLNQHALRLALKAALAMDCKINCRTFFDRKSYYYPDLPKNYQISQNYFNLGVEGEVLVPLNGDVRKVSIWNVHLEEDAGKNRHPDHPGANYSLVDINRAGTPLLEIVSGPDMHGVQEAELFMQTLRQILLYCEVSDCKMQEGSLRFEASISTVPAGSEKAGARVEIKNLNSMSAVVGALSYEQQRQQKILREGGGVERETRLWNEAKAKTERMRSKELAQDYRYFPDPDLVPVEIAEATVEQIRSELPELPLQRQRRFQKELGLGSYDAEVLTGEPALANYFEQCLRNASSDPKAVANWVINDIRRECNERKITVSEFPIEPRKLAPLIDMTEDKEINANLARKLMTKMMESGKDALTLVEQEGARRIGDENELEPVVTQVIRDNPKPVEDYRNGKKKAVGALVGQVMRATQGKADPKLVNKMLRQKLEETSA